MYRSNDTRSKPSRILIRSSNQYHSRLRPLVIVPVNLGPLIDLESVVPNVTDNADNLKPRSVISLKSKTLTNRALIWPYKMRESLVDDAHERTSRDIRFPEET